MNNFLKRKEGRYGNDSDYRRYRHGWFKFSAPSEIKGASAYLFGIEVDENKLSFLRSIQVDEIPHCKQCFARWHCAGGCLNTHFQFTPDPFEERKHQECKVTKQIVWRILKTKLGKV